MLKCPKCDSDLPNSYRYCIYCSQKLPETEQNKKRPDFKPEITPLQIGVIIGAVVMTAFLIIAFI